MNTLLTMLAQPDAPDQGVFYAEPGAGHGWDSLPDASTPVDWTVALIPLLPLLAFALAALFAAFRVKSKLPAWTTVALLAASFALTLYLFLTKFAGGHGGAFTVHVFDWINFGWRDSGDHGGTANSLIADFAFHIDSLTVLWMLFVTGLATLIALYASEYMSHDVGAGYCRFFAAFALFVFSMACLVMADNFLLLYLGWEGVGLCSYLLIGYFYKKPSAVAAAKKAFIVNRIGDLFLALGIMLIYVQFGTLRYEEVFRDAGPYLLALSEGRLHEIPLVVGIIPLLLMAGAFGKSAQLPLYVWLPDAMEGPTPVSALIHAATMVTAGVFLVARTYPLFLLSEYALPIVAWTGALTALLAATIGMAQFDIKRIMAYSTVSQLGYMFAGLGVLTSAGAGFHVFTHAFFKAMLFLACGAVMHGFAGQLDLRKLSGVGSMPGWRIVGIAMLVGCLNLAGFPVITAGYWSKDMILGEAFANPHMQAVGWILLVTAGLTAYYTFRVYFRVFVGPRYFEPGDEVHAAHDDGSHGSHATHEPDAPVAEAAVEAERAPDFHPHPPGWAINTVLAVLAVAAMGVIGLRFVGGPEGWPAEMMQESSAAYHGHAAYAAHAAHGGDHAHTADHAHATFFGFDAHKAMMVVSGVVAIIGIGIAWVLHLRGRTTAASAKADELTPVLGPIAGWARHKWYVDEFYDFLIVRPLWVLSHIFYLVDQFIVDGIVNLFGTLPGSAGRTIRPAQSGELHGYALGMAGGIAVLLLIIIMVAA